MARRGDSAAGRRPLRAPDPAPTSAAGTGTRVREHGRSGAPARVMVVHNHYRMPGGEDAVFDAECRLLESRGHDVIRYTVHNDEVDRYGAPRLALATIRNASAAREIRAAAERHGSEIVHFHNTFPLISPAAYAAARAAGASVIQTLHNYRLVCPSANLFRDGRPCQDCVGRLPIPGVVHACYRGSRAASAVTAAMLTVHRAAGTWTGDVDAYIALSEAGKAIFERGGLPAERIRVKPNFVDHDPGAGEHRGGFALFAGRLSPEKGVRTLLAAWAALGEDAPPLHVVGDGPLADEVAAALPPSAVLHGFVDGRDLTTMMKDAAFLVVPSEWPEPFGLVAIEAFAVGLPVIASRAGALAEIVDDRRTGLLFDPGDADGLARAVRWARRNTSGMSLLGDAARAEFLASYTADRNYQLLREIYDAVRAQRR